LVRLHEKGGKLHKMPCHHTLEAYLTPIWTPRASINARKQHVERFVNRHLGS
jgi:hypothetical protein